MLMMCLLIFVMFVVLLYMVPQTRMIVRLVHLLRQPGRIAQFGLAANCVFTLCFLPGLMLLLLTALLAGSSGAVNSDANLLTLMTFTPYGSAFALVSWAAMTFWFRSIVRRELAMYREPIALVPVVIMGLICITYVASSVWQVAPLMVSGPSSSGQLLLSCLVMVAVLSFVPPLVGFVLLVIHVAQVRRAKTWETYVPPEQEEIP